MAHIALSGSNHEIAIGNFIADSIQPKERALLSSDMQKGVLLHHAIDEFTDQHTAFKNTVLILRPYLRKYAPVAADIFYDHFLAQSFHDYFANYNLKEFTNEFYIALKEYQDKIPGKGHELITYILKYDWLNMYASIDGIHTILCQMASRTRFDSQLNLASHYLKKHYEEINDDFKTLFPGLMNHCKSFLRN